MYIALGMAIEITEENRYSLAVVNGGVVPNLEAVKTYFYYPSSFDGHAQILPYFLFNERYKFTYPEDPTCFIEVDKK